MLEFFPWEKYRVHSYDNLLREFFNLTPTVRGNNLDKIPTLKKLNT
jgi:hypothetical protein